LPTTYAKSPTLLAIHGAADGLNRLNQALRQPDLP
jgi:hypothetical protein